MAMNDAPCVWICGDGSSIPQPMVTKIGDTWVPFVKWQSLRLVTSHLLVDHRSSLDDLNSHSHERWVNGCHAALFIG